MKPRDKVVSAHDVESSLYYCHLTRDLDKEILRKELGEQLGRLDGDGKDGSGMGVSMEEPGFAEQRLMDSNSAGSEWEAHQARSTGQPGTQHNNQIEHAIRRKPAVKSIPDIHPDLSVPRTKILGPRPIQSGPEKPLSIWTSKHNLARDPTDLRIQQSLGSKGLGPESPSLEEPFSSTHIGNANRSSERCITLIRRDPATSNQWNIGKVSLSQTRTPASPTKRSSRRRRDVTLEVFGPGYARFRGDSATEHQSFRTNLHLSSQGLKDSNGFTAQPSGNPSQQKSTFTTPWRTSCAFSTVATGRVLKCYHSLGTAPDSASGASSSLRPLSMLVSELRFNLPSLVEKSVMKKKENRRPTSYSSNSTGRLGLSSINLSPSTLSAQYQQRKHEETKSPRWPPRHISYQDVSRTKPSLPPRPDAWNPVESNYQSSRFSLMSNEDDDNNDLLEPELDLSLGQERAGGGFSGNKAKLGKLVIYGGQGLAMLDLLVSANMGVWFNDLLEL